MRVETKVSPTCIPPYLPLLSPFPNSSPSSSRSPHSSLTPKTKDNVFITAVVSIQYQVLKAKVYDAFYSLTNPAQQITAHVYDVMRSQLPTLDLDAVFEAKEEVRKSGIGVRGVALLR